jgi:hypothetical protein
MENWRFAKNRSDVDSLLEDSNFIIDVNQTDILKTNTKNYHNKICDAEQISKILSYHISLLFVYIYCLQTAHGGSKVNSVSYIEKSTIEWHSLE